MKIDKHWQYLAYPMPITMKQLSILQESLIKGLKGLYEMECKLSVPVDHIINSTAKQDLKAEFVVYLASLRKNIKEIEYIFCLLNGRIFLRGNLPSVEGLNNYFYLPTQSLVGDTTCNFIPPLQGIIQYKMFLYQDVHGMAIKLNQPQVARILHEILEFEKDTQVIFSEIMAHDLN